MMRSETLRKTLTEFADKYRGRRAFVIGNGPSLNNMDLTKLRNEVSFGVNSIFYNFDRMGFKPTFYVVEDKLVAEDRAEEISGLTGMVKIFGTELQYCLKDSEDIIWANVIYDFSNYPGFPHFSKDASQCLWVGGTVSYLCMQLAYYMGFDEVYLIGFDHSYVIPSDAEVAGTVITSTSGDPNHFHPKYFGRGKRWHDPRTDRMEMAYKRAKEVFGADGRKIFNATKGGKLEVFPRVEYDSLFDTTTDGEKPVFSFRYMRPSNEALQITGHEPLATKIPKCQQRHKPFSHLVLDYTRLCNSRCTYCGIWKSKNEPELSLEAIERTFASLRAFGLSTCYVTGGEPYISDKVVEIARIMHQYLPKCRLSGATNAVQPQQILARLDKILQMGIPLQVHISINGSEATHDATRGCPGFWKKAVYLLDTLKSNGVKVVASMSLMPQTIADLPYMQEFCAERGVELMFSWVRQSPRYGTVDEYYSIWPEEMKRKLRRIECLPDEFDCPGLSERLVIIPDGSVYPCEVYHPDILLGNVNEQPLESMLNSARAVSMAEMISSKNCYWCQGAGDSDGSPKWMLMDCYRRHSEQAAYLARNFAQAVRMAPHASKRIIEDILGSRSIHQMPSSQEQPSVQTVNCRDKESEVRISIVACTYRNPELLAKTLDSLSRQSLDKQCFETIVVDNNSRDNTTDVVASYPSVRYVLEQKLGLSHARNAGIHAARGDIVAFLDDDAEASPGWAEALLKVYDSVPNAWAVGGKVLPIWDSEKPEWLTEEHYRFLSLVEWGQNARPLCWPERVIGTNCSFRRRVFTDIGHFDTNLGRLGSLLLSLEDTEIQQRIHETGHLVYYSPEATVYHHVAAERMTKEYLCRRTLGNTISEMLVTLRETGKEHEANQFLDWARHASGQSTDEPSYRTEERILEHAHSMFVQGHPDIPVEAKVTFVSAIAQYYAKQKRYEEAENKYNEGLSLPNISRTKVCMFLARLGNLYLEQDLYDKAEQKYRESLSIGDGDQGTKFYILKGLGICCGQRGQFAQMEQSYAAILDWPDIPDRDKVDAARAFGQCYFKYERYKEAERVYLKMLGRAAGRDKYQLLKGLGLSYAAQDRFEEMGEKLDEILSCEDFSDDCKVDAVFCFSRYYLENKRYRQAEELYSRILGRTEGKERCYVLRELGDCCGAQGRHQEMERHFEEILSSADISGDFKVDATLSFARHYSAAGMTEPAERMYLKVHSIEQLQDASRFQLVLGYGNICFEQGRYDQAKQKFDEALSIETIGRRERFWALAGLARLDLVQDRYPQAQQQYRELFFSDDYTNRQKAVLASDFANYHAARGDRNRVMEIYKQVCSLKDLTQEHKSVFAHRVKDAVSATKECHEQRNARAMERDSEAAIRISAIVCTYRNPDLLAKTLDSLSRQTLDESLYEIIVVDNNSQDSTPDVVSRYPSARYVLEEKQGLSHARNTGIGQAQGEIVAFIDDDAEASPGWLKALLDAYDSIADAWAVGGKALPIWDAERPDWLDESYHRALSLLDWGDAPRPLQWPERIIGVNCSFRREVFSNIGLFDTHLGRVRNALLASEDVEIQQRIHALGHLVYCAPQALVYHHVPASRMTREHFHNRRRGNILSLTIRSLLSQGKNEEVEALIAQVTQQSANSSDAVTDEEMSQIIKRTLRSALNQLYESPEALLGEVKRYMKTATDAIQRRNWEVAETFLRVCVDLLPDNPNAYSTLSKLYQAQGDIGAANDVFKEAQQIFPDHGTLSSTCGIGVSAQSAISGNSSSEVEQQAPSCRYLFVPSNESHVGWMLPIAERLENSRFMVFSAKNENAEFYLTKHQKEFAQYYPGILKAINPLAVVFGSDWGGYEQQAIREAKALGVPTVCIQEGCLDFQDHRVNRMKHADYAFLQGPIMRKYIGRQDNTFVTGNPKYDGLYEAPLPERVTVMINSNFTYGIYEEVRDQWVHDVAESCKELGLDFFISQHPRDKGVFTAEYRVIKSDAFRIRQQLQNTSILVSRFSTVIYEALAMGREVVYYNPHRENFRIFAEDDTGGISIADHRSELASSISSAIRNLGQNKENRSKFLMQHCGTLNHDAAKNCAENLRAITQKRICPEVGVQQQTSVGSHKARDELAVPPHETGRNDPLVSVIIPAYNAAEYIGEAIESVLIQDYGKLELIIVDDGSTDKTRDIVAGFRDDRIRYFYKENGGLASANNTGIKNSEGALVVKLDADDMMTLDFVSRHVRGFEKHPEADLVYCDDCLVDENRKPIRAIECPEYTDRKSLIRDLFRSGYPIVPFRTCIRRSVFDKIGFFDESLLVGEDYDMMRRFVRHGLKIHHLRGALYLRRMGFDSLSRNFTEQKAECLFQILGRFVDTFTYDELFPDVAWEKIPAVRRQLHAKCLVAATYLAMGQAHVKANSPPVYTKIAFGQAWSELNDCLKIDPSNPQIRQLLQKCELGRQIYDERVQQALC